MRAPRSALCIYAQPKHAVVCVCVCAYFHLNNIKSRIYFILRPILEERESPIETKGVKSDSTDHMYIILIPSQKDQS